MKTRLTLILLALGGGTLLRAAPAQSAEDWRSEFDRPAIHGPYSESLDKLANDFPSSFWEALPPALSPGENLKLECYSEHRRSTALGVAQSMLVNASIEQVGKLVEDAANYQRLCPGYDDVKLLERRGNTWLTYWEQHVPFPFSNVKLRMRYKLLQSGATRIYRYQLTYGSDVRYSDGVIVLTPAGKQTRYFEVDLWDTKIGLGALVLEDIFREGIKGVYACDQAVRMNAEQPALSPEDARKKSLAGVDEPLTKKCVAERKPFSPFWVTSR